MNKYFLFTLLAIGLVTGSPVAADIQIAVTGTADSTDLGYLSGQSYTFTWTISDGYSGSSNDSFNSTSNSWYAEVTSDPILYGSLSGDGLVGTYSRVSGTPGAPWEYATAEAPAGNPMTLDLFIGNDDAPNSNHGLTVNGTDLRYIDASSIEIIDSFAFPESFTNPASYFSSYAGTYAAENGWISVVDTNWDMVDFTVTNVTITPEPATMSLLALGGMAILKRRKRK